MFERYSYTPYGAVTFMSGNWGSRSSSSYDNPVLFCGYWYDAETGMYHVRNRMYNPSYGRWGQRDPIGYVDGGNVYLYCWGRPTVGIDPMGTAAHNKGPVSDVTIKGKETWSWKTDWKADGEWAHYSQIVDFQISTETTVQFTVKVVGVNTKGEGDEGILLQWKWKEYGYKLPYASLIDNAVEETGRVSGPWGVLTDKICRKTVFLKQDYCILYDQYRTFLDRLIGNSAGGLLGGPEPRYLKVSLYGGTKLDAGGYSVSCDVSDAEEMLARAVAQLTLKKQPTGLAAAGNIINGKKYLDTDGEIRSSLPGGMKPYEAGKHHSLWLKPGDRW